MTTAELLQALDGLKADQLTIARLTLAKYGRRAAIEYIAQCRERNAAEKE